MDDNSRKDRITAAALTALILALTVAGLLTIVMTYPPKDRPELLTADEDSDLLFGGEYVMLGDLPLPVNQSPAPTTDPTESGLDLEASGEPGEASPTVTGSEPSPMEVGPQPDMPEKKGPSAEELARQEAAHRIGNRVQFGSAKQSTTGGTPGSANGNATSGALSGQPGHNLDGRRLLNSATPDNRTASGSIEVTVTVDRDGHVTSARATGGTPPASTNAAVRRSCVEASKRLRFSPRADAPASQSGVITWVIN